MHIFGKGAGARGGDGGERDQQSLIGYPDRWERTKIDACRASRARRTQGMFTCRALDARRALQCDLATFLLKKSTSGHSRILLDFFLANQCLKDL